MKHRMSMLRRIVSVTVIGIIIFLVSGITLSLKWPTHWNFMLGSLFLSIIASFMGILVGILVAILVVGRYLGHQRREAERKEALREAAYQARWQAYLHGGLSVLSALITHLALFVAYGKNKYLELLEARGGVLLMYLKQSVILFLGLPKTCRRVVEEPGKKSLQKTIASHEAWMKETQIALQRSLWK